MTKPLWTLLAIGTLGRLAHADPEPVARTGEVLTLGSAHRGVAQDYLVMPSGGELTGQMKFVMADASANGPALHFTDLALFGLTGRWVVLDKLELAATVDLLPKQPSAMDEKVWQSVNAGVRVPIGRTIAIGVAGGGGHLVSHTGAWTRASAMVEWNKPIQREFLSFDLQAGADATSLADDHARAWLAEVTVQTTALFHEPSGHWGGWVGIAYGVPVQHGGTDPTTGAGLAPRPRLDFHLGTVLAAVRQWDLFADFAVIGRGDLDHRASQLPILDGGFPQRQIILGVTRHIERPRHDTRDDDALRLSRAE
jgi:hypothetical protein